jgi:hypothetical protein
MRSVVIFYFDDFRDVFYTEGIGYSEKIFFI